MAAAEDIRARVKALDEQRIRDRGDRAASVAETYGEWVAGRAELGRRAGLLASAVEQALKVMTLDELVNVTGLKKSELPITRAPARTAVKAGSTRPRKPAAVKNGRAAPSDSAAAESAATE